MKKGHLIVFEGIDGGGKSTARERVAEFAIRDEYECFLTKEPTDGPYGKKIRNMLTSAELAAAITPYEFQKLYVQDRLDHTPELEKQISLGKLVLCDRNYWSTFAYGMPACTFEQIDELHKNIFALGEKQLLRPRLVVYIHIPVAIALERKRLQGQPLEFFEEVKKLETISNNYQLLMERKMDECIVVDGRNSPESVASEIWSEIKKILYPLG